MQTILKNWKTSLSGLIVGLVSILVHLGKIDPTTGNAIIGITGSLGLLSAQDGNISGGAGTSAAQ
jgi:hypothetical protein